MPATPSTYRLKNFPDCPQAFISPKACFNDKIRPLPLFAIRNLLGQDAGVLGSGHTRSGQHSARLHESRRADHANTIATLLAAGFKQQRYIEDDGRAAASRHARQEHLFIVSDHGMEDRLKPPQSPGIAENNTSELTPINTASMLDARKHSGDGGDGSAARTHQGVHCGVGIVDRHALAFEHARRRRLAHANRPGQAKDDHPPPPRKAARTWSRRAAVTSGSCPNHAVKPGRA